MARQAQAPTTVKPAHHRGTYQVDARRITQMAYADPDTRCWRCERTLEQVPMHKTGRRPFWTAGHKIDSQAGGELAAECSVCNYTHGAEYGNTLRGTCATSRKW